MEIKEGKSLGLPRDVEMEQAVLPVCEMRKKCGETVIHEFLYVFLIWTTLVQFAS